jgi:hypothetical protein
MKFMGGCEQTQTKLLAFYFSFQGLIMAEEVRDSLNSMRSQPWKNG